MNINNDLELKNTLNGLSREQQRRLGACYTEGVIGAVDNPRLMSALKVALLPESTDQELKDAYKVAKSIATKTYTACGRDADWGLQAEHFIAAACAAALTPDALTAENLNVAWKAAIHSRMAKNCLMIESDSIEAEGEADRQYRLTEAFLAG
ncbi:hypothetical protein [Sedimenticola hydrogenitrophicus]|uniref:hypothetical protein n=1 Tax=Sedimenticola hydrogenitrophicus TaxID=2967975 RepID=UPI0021A6F51E|nr:hypothetical protein [Sedimenticola hydrogenitrophicus]